MQCLGAWTQVADNSGFIQPYGVDWLINATLNANGNDPENQPIQLYFDAALAAGDGTFEYSQVYQLSPLP
jgi:hypothetical protein